MTTPDTTDDPTERRASYALVMTVYAALVATAVATIRRRGIRLPERISPLDLAVTAIATHRLARLVAKDPVTSPLRAPFTEFVDVQGPAELEERARDTSRLRHTVGELVSCPFCLDQWIATTFVLGHVVAPRGTRLTTSVFASAGVADWLHHALARLRG